MTDQPTIDVITSPTGLVTITIRRDVPDDQYPAAVAELAAMALTAAEHLEARANELRSAALDARDQARAEQVVRDCGCTPCGPLTMIALAGIRAGRETNR